MSRSAFIFDSLSQWREERGLQSTLGNIKANISEEITEYLRANDDFGRVDALCDIFVFSINGLNAVTKNANDIIYYELEYRSAVCDNDYFKHIIRIFSDMAFDYDLDHTLPYMCFWAKCQIELLGFDFYIAMDETLKEIHSRKGAFNEETNKWEKFKTPEAMALWYKADYSKAKK